MPSALYAATAVAPQDDDDSDYESEPSESSFEAHSPTLTRKQERKQKAKQNDSLKLMKTVFDMLSLDDIDKRRAKTGSSKLPNPLIPQHPHRPRISQSLFGLVARLINKSDPEYKSPKVAAATLKQITTLFANGVWELVPREWSEVKAEARRNGEEVLMGRCHSIVSIKHSEREEQYWEFKVRGVFGGHNVRDENGAQKFFEDNGSCPAGIGSARTATAYAAAVDGDVEAADAEAAYVQSLLTGPRTFCILPPEWTSYMPPNVQKAAATMHSPVFRMLKSLYGHPCAGKCWEDHLNKVLLSQNWVPIEGMKSCFINHRVGNVNGPVFLCVYVDDFIMSGRNLKDLWVNLRKEVKFGEDPMPLD